MKENLPIIQLETLVPTDQFIYSTTACATEETSGAEAEMELKQHHYHRKILVVDDDPINREIALELLQDVCGNVDSASNGAEALQALATRQYDLIFMDMQMPVMDGIEATKAIRNLSGCAEMPIIAITANAFNEDRERCLEVGMSDFLSKPVEPEVLFSKLLKWFG
jgi:CheY-like chemotaxis protein